MSTQNQPTRKLSPPDGLAEAFGLNAGYVVEQYERYLRDPNSVDPRTQAWFQTLSPSEVLEEAAPVEAVSELTIDLIVGAVRLARAIRAYGHLAARFDPLGSEPPGDPSLQLVTYGLTEEDLARLPAHVVGGPVAEGAPNAAVAIERLHKIYCDTTGYEFRHVQSAAERAWLQNAIETRRFDEPREGIDGPKVLRELTEVEAFEQFLHRTFPGQKRFSIEGMDVLVPMLFELIGCAAEEHVQSTWIGMAHRGRLSVLATVLGKPWSQIFAEVAHTRPSESISESERDDLGWSGDVTYHLGARAAFKEGREVAMTVGVAPNPSHLEFVDPVVEGMCRAADERRDVAGPPQRDADRSLVVLIHGDAAFLGEGVVAETLNLSRLPGYTVGGTLHIITNNQLGFTTPPASARSTLYASDLAKGFEIPIVHVDADDPRACIDAMRLAHAYRQVFHRDFLIDLVGYRRWGHNEGDEPTFTQPLLYQKIREHRTVRALWAERLATEGEVTVAEATAMLRDETAKLQAAYNASHAAAPRSSAAVKPPPRETTDEIITAVPAERLVRLNDQLNRVPSGFALNPKLTAWLERRRAALSENGTIDWAEAEALAFAALLAEGTPIRLTGQDVERGTFSQRHLVLHDAKNGEIWIPLQRLPDARASFAVHDSPLAEVAPLGFEYGYSIQARDALVLWEAQFGDFANVAQVLIDQFIASGYSKWGQAAGLVLLLPHALEGQGPEHSSARLERFLQLAAQQNYQIANCTTPAQYFHLLRRQAALLRRRPRPLVVFTPKSLLRHPLATSKLDDLAHGWFRPVLDDPAVRQRSEEITRLVLGSGHVYVNLIESPVREQAANVAIARIEQLYPFPTEQLEDLIAGYPRLREVVWAQEEPMNMGAWSFVAPRLASILRDRLPLLYVGRSERASPAVGAHHVYVAEQEALVGAAFQQANPAAAALGVEVVKI
jgi:2-oxoglutarate dehydrogenase E1 component